MERYYGELAALATSIFWTVTALSFEFASKRVGSLAVNILRLIIGLVFLSCFSWIARGYFMPTDASTHQWIWLSLSGLVGFVFGDYFLFKAFAVISSRIALLVMTLAPPLTALISWVWLGEVMNLKQVAAMFIVVIGISMAIFGRGGDNKEWKIKYSLSGLFFAFLGMVGQAGGLVLSKYGMQGYNAFAATQIRIIAGVIGFLLIILILGKSFLVRKALKDRPGMAGISTGAFFGPFLGVSFSLMAIKYTETGIAATLMSLSPILLILPSYLLFKQKITTNEIIGAFISIFGVTFFFI